MELNVTGTEEACNKCDPESRYLDSVVFNLFARCFEKANQLYDYFIPTRYNTRYIIPLRNNLMTHLARLEQIRPLEEFRIFLNEQVLGKEFINIRSFKSHGMPYHHQVEILSGQTSGCLNR